MASVLTLSFLSAALDAIGHIPPAFIYLLQKLFLSISLISILFKSLWKKSLRPLSGCSYPCCGLSSGGCRAVSVVAEAQASVGNGRTGTEGTCVCRPVGDLRLCSSELGSWSSPFTLRFLLGHSPCSSFSISSGLCRSREQA